MVGFLLFLLKIIGIILASLIVIVLILLAALLLSYIKYDIKCGNDKDTYFNGNVSYLFGILKITAGYENGETEVCINVFGRQIYPSEKKVKTAKRVKKDNKPKKKETEEKTKTEVQTEIKKVKVIEQKKKVPEKVLSWDEKYKGVSEGKEEFEVRRISIKNIEEITETEKESKAKNTQEEEKVNAKYFLNLPLEDKKIILKSIYKFIKRFLKSVIPKSVKIDAKAGTGDVYYTGLMLAVCGIVKGMIFEDINIEGDFDKAGFIGNTEFGGRFTLGYLLYITLMLVIIKPIRKIIVLLIKN